MKQVFAFLLSIWFIANIGCSAIDEISSKGAFQDTTKAYASSMRWSDFDTATLLVKQPNLPGPDVLSNIKITTYEVKQHLVVQEGHKIRQLAGISYFKKSDMLLKTISVEEIWEYHQEEKVWYLTKGFPDFE